MARGVRRAVGGAAGEGSTVVFCPQWRGGSVLGASTEQRERTGVWGVARKVVRKVGWDLE